MAFSVTPTSGSGPYIFTAEFLNKNGADYGRYSIEATADGSNFSCPINTTIPSISVPITTAFRNGDTYTRSLPVDAGTCYTVVVRIRDLSTGDIIDSALASVNNLA